MPSIFEMSSIAPPRIRQPKPDVLTAWDPAILREEMAASVRQDMRKSTRMPPPTGHSVHREAETANKVLAALNNPLTSAQVADKLGMPRRTAAATLCQLKDQGQVRRTHRVGRSWIWERVE
jgi:predicted Rossmann fold nucleotide-binding protein DprA/Smf involved in DNA uptake